MQLFGPQCGSQVPGSFRGQRGRCSKIRIHPRNGGQALVICFRLGWDYGRCLGGDSQREDGAESKERGSPDGSIKAAAAFSHRLGWRSGDWIAGSGGGRSERSDGRSCRGPGRQQRRRRGCRWLANAGEIKGSGKWICKANTLQDGAILEVLAQHHTQFPGRCQLRQLL